MSGKRKILRAEDMPPPFHIPPLEVPEDIPLHRWRGYIVAHHMKHSAPRDSEGWREFNTKWKQFYGEWKNPQPHLVNWMINTGRVYYEPGTPIIVERDGAQVLIYAQDLTKDSRELLKEKILNAIRFSGPLQNYKELNALMTISNSGGYYPNTMGALFLRLTELTAMHAPADEKGNIKTFLELCGEHGFSLGANETPDKAALKTKLKAVLKSAGISRLKETQQLLREWTTKDIITIRGHVQLEEQGVYSSNAAVYLKRYNTKYHDFNRLVSASYGITAETIRVIRSKADEMFDGVHVGLAITRHIRPEMFTAIVKSGEEIQMKKLAEKIKTECKGMRPKKLSARGKEFFKKMLNHISYESLKMIAFSGYGIVYAPNQLNISSIYPGKQGEGVLGYDAKSCDVTRQGPGVYIPKVKTLMVVDGESIKFWGAADLYIKLCMTIMHESVHIGLSHPDVLSSPAFSGDVDDLGFHGKDSMIAHIDEFLRDACAKLQTLTPEEQAKYTNWGTLLNTTSMIKEIFSDKCPEMFSYDEAEWIKELICNWHAMSAKGGQYAKGAVKDNIFHSSGKDDAEPEQLKIFREGTWAVRGLIADIAHRCMDHTGYKIPGINAPLKKEIGSPS